MAEFADFVERTRTFLLNLVFAVMFFVYGGFFAGYWLAVTSFPTTSYTWLINAGGAFALGFTLWLIVIRMPWPSLRMLKPLRYEGLRWIASFITPFIVAPVVINSLPAEFQPSWVWNVWWYPTLAVALLLVSILVEGPLMKANPGVIKARPFLVAGSLELITSPFPFLAYMYLRDVSGWLISLSLMLVTYSIAGLHALRNSLKAFTER